MIRWAGPKDYETKASAYLNSLRVFVTNLRGRLAQAGVLTASDGQNGPTLKMVVWDQPFDRTIPLPVIDWRLQH